VSTTQEGAVGRVLELLLRHGVTAVRVGRPSLAEVYRQLIGGDRGLRV
jgi:hypothetical protein